MVQAILYKCKLQIHAPLEITVLDTNNDIRYTYHIIVYAVGMNISVVHRRTFVSSLSVMVVYDACDGISYVVYLMSG